MTPSRPAALEATRLWPAALAAVLLPTLISYDGAASPRAWQQIAAFVGWGFFCTVLAKRLQGAALAPAAGRLRWLFGALAVIAVGTWLAPLSQGVPPYVALATCGFLAATALCAGLGALVQRAGLGEEVFRRFCEALVAAAACGVLIGAVQFFMPQWTDTLFVAASNAGGRIGGNLRQPNLLCSLTLMGLAALVWRFDAAWRQAPADRRGTVVAVVLALWLGAGAAATLSRTGAVSLGLLCVWALLDRGFSRRSRLLVAVFAVTFCLVWPNVYAWQPLEAFALQNIVAERNAHVASMRVDLWLHCLELIRQHPFAGVGWGELNLAWTLTPLKRGVLHFPDHAHNLELHLAVELGLPLAVLACALLIGSLGSAVRAFFQAIEPDRRIARTAGMMVLVIVAHSQLEFPLWVACLLLPTAFALGLALGARQVQDGPGVAPVSGRLGQALVAGALALTFGGLWGAADFARTMRVSGAGAEAPEAVKGIVFYRLQAERIADETLGLPLVDRDLARAAHVAPLLPAETTAWAQRLARQGETDKARYLVQRAREWGRKGPPPAFFEPCREDAAPETRPFQCAPPAGVWTFRDFQRP